jgi:hypothetical protein
VTGPGGSPSRPHGNAGEGDDAMPDEANLDAQALAVLGDALNRLGANDIRALADMVILLCAHPQWAVWLPVGGRGWTAVRPAGSRPPGPDVPMVWVQARTPVELEDAMRRAEARLSPDAQG